MTGLNPRLIYDVGLHKGEDTDFYLKKGFDVVALEANPELIAQCKMRFRDAIAQNRVRIIEGAIAPPSVGDTVSFYKISQKSDWGTINGDWADRNAKLGFDSEKIVLPRIDMGEVYRSYGIPFYLKIDVEGVDKLVLENLKQFADRPRYLSIESEKVDFDALRADLGLLRELGYTKFKPVQQAATPGTSIKTKTLDGPGLDYVFGPHASGPFGEDIPQAWLSLDETLRAYETIFRRYRRFGDKSLFNRLPGRIKKMAELSYGAPLPGWHDIHASL